MSGGELVITNGGANNTNTRAHRALTSSIDVTASTDIWFTANVAYSGGTDLSQITMGNMIAATTFDEAVVPEPSTGLLAVFATAAMFLRRRRA